MERLKTTSEDYIQNKYEDGFSDKADYEKYKNLFLPFTEVDCQDEGLEKINFGDYKISFDYTEVPPDMKSIQKDENLVIEPTELRRIKNLTLEMGESKMELIDIISDDCEIYFFIERSSALSDFVLQRDGKQIIVLNGMPNNWATILALLHEAGHADFHIKDEDVEFAPSDLSDRRSVNVDDLAKKIFEERKSWAYALKRIKPFVLPKKEVEDPKELTVENVKNFVHARCLKSYADLTQNEIGNRQLMKSFANDVADDMSIWQEE